MLRQMDFPPEVSLTKSAQLRWLCLSLGLLSENESRDTVLSIADGLFTFLLAKKSTPSTADLAAWLKTHGTKPVSEKLLRYHLHRFIEVGLIVRKNQAYHFNQSPTGARHDLADAFYHGVEKPTLETLQQIGRVCEQLAPHFSRKGKND
jgi:hypothetical protein